MQMQRPFLIRLARLARLPATPVSWHFCQRVSYKTQQRRYSTECFRMTGAIRRRYETYRLERHDRVLWRPAAKSNYSHEETEETYVRHTAIDPTRSEHHRH